MSRRGRLLSLLVALGLGAWLPAGPAQAQKPEAPAPDRPGPRDELFKMIDAYLVSNLQESLGLTDDQFVKLLPLVKRLQTDRRSFQQRRMQALRDLRQLLRSGTATESRIEALLGEVKAVEAEEPSAIKKHLDAIDATLDPVQQAKYRVLEVEVEQKLRQILAEARRQNRPAAPGPRRGRQAEPPP